MMGYGNPINSMMMPRQNAASQQFSAMTNSMMMNQTNRMQTNSHHGHHHHSNSSSHHHQNNSQNQNQNNQNNGNNQNNKGPTKDTWLSPFKTREQNINFFMYAYKCEPCPLRRNCGNKVTCPGWHHEGEKRRNPGEEPNFLYSEEPCPNVKPQGSNKWQPPSRCKDGDECGYSHTLLEQMYHPNIYKTSMCINFTNPQGNKCQWGYYCTHAHGQDDIRNPNNKKSGSNEAANDNETSNENHKDKNKSSPLQNGNIDNTHNVQPMSAMLSEKKKLEKRLRSQSAQSNLPAMYQGVNDGSNMYMNGGHLRSPQFGYNQLQSGHISHNLAAAQLPPPNMHQYNTRGSPNASNDNSPYNSMNDLQQNNLSTPPRAHTHTSHRADFSPVPFTAEAARQYVTNPPPQLNLHDPNSGMYATQPHNANYPPEASFVPYAQAQFRKRGRSVSDNTGLVPYLGATKASQQPNMYHRYQSQESGLQPQTTYPFAPPNSADELPMMNPSFADASRVSRTYQVTQSPPHDQQSPGGSAVKQLTIQTDGEKPNTSTPPPPNAEQVKNSPYREFTFQDASMLQPPRTVRSISHGNIAHPSHSGGNHPYVTNASSLAPELHKLTASSSLPSRYDNKVPPLPNQQSNDLNTPSYQLLNTPADLGRKRRARSGSEPLPPLPKYNMVSDNIWRTNPNQEPTHSGGNVDGRNVPTNQTPSHSNSRSRDPFSSKRLTSIPDNMDDSVTSPNALIDTIITPRSPGQVQRTQTSSNDTSTAADWSYFGFTAEDVMSPVPDSEPALSQKKKPKLLNVPKTPPPPKLAAVNSADAVIQKLKKELKTAQKQIEQLKTHKTPDDTDNAPDENEKAALGEFPPLGSLTKKSVNLKGNDDEKEKDTQQSQTKSARNRNAANEELQKQQLARYKHFITCPSCKMFDPQTPRNQVLIPCGHLICGKCSSHSKQSQKCPICDDVIQSYQLLIIG